MLPEGWERKTVADICILQNGNGFKPHQWDTKGLPIIRIQNLNGSSNFNYFSGNPLEKWLVNPGQILFSWAGSKGVSFGPFIWNGPQGVLNQHIFKVFSKEKIDKDWLYLILRSITDKIEGQAHGFKATLVHVKKQDIDNQIVNIPPLPEQKKIAAILSTWDRAIEGTEKLLANSQQQKKALMQQLLTGKKRLPGFMEEWKTVTIGSRLKEVKRPVEWKDDNFYKLLSVKRRSEGVILREVLHGTKILTKKMNYAKSGDFLISKMQIVHGASGLVPEHLDNHHISDSYIALRAKNPEKFDIEFFSWLSKQRVMYHKTFLCSYGVTIEKMTFNFNMYLKENIKIPPTVTEQRSISRLLNTTENEITALESDLSRLRQEKKALMQQLLTGKRRVTVD